MYRTDHRYSLEYNYIMANDFVRDIQHLCHTLPDTGHGIYCWCRPTIDHIRNFEHIPDDIRCTDHRNSLVGMNKIRRHFVHGKWHSFRTETDRKALQFRPVVVLQK